MKRKIIILLCLIPGLFFACTNADPYLPIEDPLHIEKMKNTGELPLPGDPGTTAAGSGTSRGDDKCHGPGYKTHVKNIIIMIADGSGYNHKAAASLYQYGRETSWLYKQFPVKIGMSTYAHGGSYDTTRAWSDFYYVSSGATDSAAAATAMSTGNKTCSSAIGMDISGEPIKHMIEWAEEAGKSTGVITSVEISQATPAGFVAHNTSRYDYEAIAREMICQSAVDVIMGCGHPFYDSNGEPVPEPLSFEYVGGEETWNNLTAGVAGNDADGDGDNDPWTLIQTKREFLNLVRGKTPSRVIGIPRVHTTLQQARSGDTYADPFSEPLIRTVPSLGQMAKAALNVLDQNKKGFLLMIEGGAIDWASHSNQSGRMIEEELAFSHAVKNVLQWVRRKSNWGETLLIVTSDHETGYLYGPGSGADISTNPVWYDIINNGRKNLPGMDWFSTGHTNSLVPFFAKGRYARQFRWASYRNYDLVHHGYIDNTDLGNMIIQFLQ
jgi:alkaline phosphatase